MAPNMPLPKTLCNSLETGPDTTWSRRDLVRSDDPRSCLTLNIQQSWVRHFLIPMLLAMTTTLWVGSSEAARLYRWVDADGVVHYTDRIPPSQVEKGHTELNQRGIAVEDIPPAQTIEEIKRERELERLRAQQERLVEQQNAADQALLRTFRSADDLIMARDGKVAAIDVVIGVARSNIRRQQEWLRNLRTEAANLERAGKPVSQHIEDGIAKTERYIRETYASIVVREQQKDEILQEFNRDLKRFRQLNDIPPESIKSATDTQRPALRNLVTCYGQDQCKRLWERAVDYVRHNATTPVQTSGPNILITAPPETKEDLSLTLSLIQDEDADTASLFLDLQCKSADSRATSCKDDRARHVLDGFQSAIADLPGQSGE